MMNQSYSGGPPMGQNYGNRDFQSQGGQQGPNMGYRNQGYMGQSRDMSYYTANNNQGYDQDPNGAG
jgi:hypothetical protein